jgi:hypothetical protein
MKCPNSPDEVYASDEAKEAVDSNRLNRFLRVQEFIWLLFVLCAVIEPFLGISSGRSDHLTLLGVSVAGVIMSRTYSRVLLMRAVGRQ